MALIGASGSGKSTLLRTINLLERVDDGQVFLRGIDISRPQTRPDGIRARIGMVFQQFNLFPHLTVLDNVTLASRRGLGIDRPAAERTARELLDQVGLADRANASPAASSSASPSCAPSRPTQNSCCSTRSRVH